MSIILSEQYTVSFAFKERNGQLEIGLSLMAMDDGRLLSLGIHKASNIDNIFSIIHKSLDDKINAFDSYKCNLIDFQKKHWQQYRNNCYHIYDFMKICENDFLLFFIEYYSMLFSMEMTYFLKNLEAYDINILNNFFNLKANHEDPFYSEILEFKSFYSLYTKLGTSK